MQPESPACCRRELARHPEPRRAAAMVVALVLGLTGTSAGCAGSPAVDEDPRRQASTGNRWVELLLFPINVVPDIVGNTLVLVTIPLWAPFTEEPLANLPALWIGSPLFGPVIGIRDAWRGYPFWRPGAFVEMLHDDLGGV